MQPSFFDLLLQLPPQLALLQVQLRFLELKRGGYVALEGFLEDIEVLDMSKSLCQGSDF